MTPAVLDPATWVDHSWLVTGTGVLFCLAGSTHTTTAVAGCAYYLRDDLAADLTARLALPPPRTNRRLSHAGASYTKLPDIAPPADWPRLHAALHPHGVTAMPWSLLAALDPNRATAHIDPHTAARTASRRPHPHACGQTVLRDLLARLGDPDGAGKMLGLTGSAALDPARLCDSPDLDLLTYPDLDHTAFTGAVHTLGGRYLAELPPGDPRLAAYAASRFLPANPRTSDDRVRMWSRRRDVAWIGDLRLDLTPVPDRARTADRLPYTAADLGPVTTNLTLDTVTAGYPVRLTGRTPTGARLGVLVTARGYDSVLRPGDRIHLAGRLHRHPHNPAFASVDDHPGHHLHLEPPA
jgi:hypothetical protein